MFTTKALFKAIEENIDLEIKLKKIREILQNGVDPNIPLIEPYLVGWIGGSNNHTIYALHRAINPEIVSLLLEFGANQNNRGFSMPGDHEFHYPEGQEEYDDVASEWDDLTPLEAACKCSGEYQKALVLASYKTFNLSIQSIENAIKLLMDIKQKKSVRNMWGTNDKQNVMKLLVSKLNQNHLLLLLNEADVQVYLNTHKWAHHLFQFYKEQHEEINRLAFVWVMFNRCIDKKNSIISNLSSDILKLILFHALPNKDALEYIVGDSTSAQVLKNSAFKKIYTILSENHTFGSHDFLKNRNNEKPVRMIRNIQNKIDNDPTGMTTVAWELALSHYNDFSSNNVKLVKQLMEWCQPRQVLFKMALFDSWKEACTSSLRNSIIQSIDGLNSKEVNVDEQHNPDSTSKMSI